MSTEKFTTVQPSSVQAATLSADVVFQKMVTPQRVTATEAEQELLAGATPSHILHGDKRLTVWQWGQEGPRVLLVHGWDSRASHLYRFINTLLAAGYQVLAFDGPGHGDSGGSRSNVVDMGQAVLRVVESIGPVEAAVGHSMGSPALLYAFAHGLSVSVSIHLAGPSSLARVLHRTATMTGLNTTERDRLTTLMEVETGMPVEDMELSRLAHGFRHPALILHDPDDREIPFEESQLLEAAWPQARLHAVSGVGHRRIVGDRAVVDLSMSILSRYLPVSRPDEQGAGS